MWPLLRPTAIPEAAMALEKVKGSFNISDVCQDMSAPSLSGTGSDVTKFSIKYRFWSQKWAQWRKHVTQWHIHSENKWLLTLPQAFTQMGCCSSSEASSDEDAYSSGNRGFRGGMSYFAVSVVALACLKIFVSVSELESYLSLTTNIMTRKQTIQA
jgi:hypothetical protein